MKQVVIYLADADDTERRVVETVSQLCEDLDDGTYYDVIEGATRVDSPSGWSYMSTQETDDSVDCQGCGKPLSDTLPIVNDAEGYAYHEGCRP